MKGSGWSAPELMVKPGVAGSPSAGGSKYGVASRARCRRPPPRARRSRGSRRATARTRGPTVRPRRGRPRRTRRPPRAPPPPRQRRMRWSGPGGGSRAAPTVPPWRSRHGEELGMATPPLGDDRKKGGENHWISRIAIDLALARGATFLQFGDNSPPNLKRAPQGRSEGSPKGSRKAERREAERTLQGEIEGWERTPQGGRDRSGYGDSALRWSVVRHGGFPGADVAGSGGGCPTRPRPDASGTSLTWPRGAREASAERLLGVASRPGSGSPFRSPCTGNAGRRQSPRSPERHRSPVGPRQACGRARRA